MEKGTLTLNQALPLFEENLSEIRKACIENVEEIIRVYSPYSELDIDTSDWTTNDIELHINYLYIQQHAYPMLQTIKRIDSYRYHQDPKNQNNSMVTDLDIANAKSVEKEWFIQEANLSTGRISKGQCPFHPDNDPSLTLMKSKQTGNYYLKCFPCSKSWDSIGFLMERDSMTFMEAVKRIVC